MKQIKLQETQFGNDKLFQQAQILKDNPELLEGKPVEFEVVSPDYERTSELKGIGVFDDFVNDKCKKCPNLNYIKDDELECGLTKNTIRTTFWGVRSHHSYFGGIKKCPLHNKGKKLGTMKLELECVGKLMSLSVDDPYHNGSEYGEAYLELDNCEDGYWLSAEENAFIVDNDYFELDDLVVVLKVSEVVRYEN